MKKIFLIPTFAFVIGLSSCSDSFLELEPMTGQVEANFYKTEADAKLAVYAIYDSYQTSFAADVLGMSEAFSDDAFAGGATATDFLMYRGSEDGYFEGENDNVEGLWKRCYEGIYRANLYMSKEGGITYSSPEVKARLHSEALFLRGYMYWDLVRHYGWAPLITSVLPSTEDYKSLPQNTPAQLYTQIASDLLASLSGLPEVVSTEEEGRITKDAARALIARIYLYHTGISQISGLGLTAGTWGDGTTVINASYAANALTEIIDGGRHDLVPTFSELWSWDNQYNEEVILAMVFSKLGQSGWATNGDNANNEINGNMFTQRCGVRDGKVPTDVDGGVPLLYHGWSGCTVSWDLYTTFSATDARRDVTIFDANTKCKSYTAAYQNTGYFNNKFLPYSAYKTELLGDKELNWERNIFDIRYADVLLMAAELGVNPMDNINLVRKRANLPELTSAPTLDQIFDERRLEFAGEGLRKWDLLRRGLSYAKAAAQKSFQVPATAVAADFSGRDFNNIDQSWGMMPCPAVEIRNCNAGVLKQFIPAYK